MGIPCDREERADNHDRPDAPLPSLLKVGEKTIEAPLESVPKGIDLDEVASVINNIDQVKDVHDIHIWQITSGMYSMTCHVVLEEVTLSESGKILHLIHHSLDERFHITHANIQLEGEDYTEEHNH